MSALTPTALSMVRADSKQLLITVGSLPSTGLAGYKAWFTAKNKVSDLDNAAVFQHSTLTSGLAITTVGSDTVNGLLTVTLTPADTSSQPDYAAVLHWDCQVEDSSGNVTTIAYGTLEIDPDYTRAS